MSSFDELLACFPTADYARCEELAARELARGGDPILWWFVTHARVRTGQFASARSALDELSTVDPTRTDMARYYSNHVYREELEHRACTEAELLNELREFDFRDSELTQAETAHVSGAFDAAHAILSKPEHSVRGRMTLTSGQTHEFSDLRDTDDIVGRHLPIYLHDRMMHLPFSWIRTVSIAEDLRMFFFDDLWVPAEVTLHPRAPLQYVRARIPARYPGWSDADASVREGKVTTFYRDHGYRRATGLRDYEMVVETITSLVGILQLRHIEFFTLPS